MASEPEAGAATATTTEAVAADAASREEGGASAAPQSVPRHPGEGQDYSIGTGVRQPLVTPYERQHGDPLYRPLRIYTVDPSVSRL